MSIKNKTIGPMSQDIDGYWILEDGSFLCGDVLRERFNIPKTATRLWVTLTKHRPKHHDAIRVRWDRAGNTRLDDDTDENECYIVYCMRKRAEGFGFDFYATIYYE